ncbi:MAG: bile acid:sodium symporter [Acidobacteria bacterium]|nr:bile acid:sodium symporter [Acidobacteriota bacterium]
MDLKQAAISTCTIVFVLSSMLGMGLGLRVAEIAAPLRNRRLVMLSLVANFIVMPALAVALARLLRLDEPLGIGLLLLGAAGGAPLLPKLAQMARGNLAFAVGLMVLLMVITVGYIPIVLPLLLPGISVNPAQIARSLILLMLLPLGAALAVNAYRPRLAARVKPPLDRIANVSLVALIALQTLLNLRSVAAVFGTFGAGYATGWALGGPARDTRVVLGLGTSQRNIAASVVVGQNFDDPAVVVMIVVAAVASSLMLVPLARMLATRATPIESPTAPT